MLSIEYCDVEEALAVGDLFEQIGFSKTTIGSDESGDSYVSNEWPIEVMSLDGFYPVEGFRWTSSERQVELIHTSVGSRETVSRLTCSPEHLVLKRGIDNEWVKVGDLFPGDVIVGIDGDRKIDNINNIDEHDRLCDLQVAIAHSYYASGVLSHNSHFLTMLGANAMRLGKNVLHYSMELSAEQIGIRYDSNLLDIDSNELFAYKDKVKEMYSSDKFGRLKIKYFPTNTASIFTLRAHIERLELHGFSPDLIIIDYADIMRSTRQFDSLRHELKLVYEELRGYSGEKKVPIWTASQSNKEGSSADIVDLNNMSEAYGKAMVADVVVSISRKPQEKASGQGRLFIAKNRAGRDGILYPIRIDTARSKFEITGSEGTFDEARRDDEAEFKRDLKRKWDAALAEEANRSLNASS